MKYNTIKYNDVANGDGVCVSLYVQGCPHHCKGCFNPETWDFNEGVPFTDETAELILSSLKANNTKRDFCILGGEPLYPNNIDTLINLCKYLKDNIPDLIIYLWTGYTYEQLTPKQKNILNYIDVLIDGPFIEAKKDISLRYCGSSNQRVIDVKATLYKGEIIWNKM